MHESEEILKLRRASRDMIAITSLSSIWTHYGVDQVGSSLAETLVKSLSLSFVYVQIYNGHEQVNAGYAAGKYLTQSQLEDLKISLKPWLTLEKLISGTRTLSNILGNEKLQVNFSPIGHNFKNGILITASTLESFPSDADRLILNIASNQINVTVEHKWSQSEAQRLLKFAEEKESKLKEATRQAEMATDEAVKANELKSTFLANMSHEIRTPLGAILGFTEVLKSPTLRPAERNEYLEIITRSGQSLIKIIDDILDLSKIEAGKLEIEPLPLSIMDLCKEVIAMFSDRATGKGVEIIFDGSNLPSFYIISDQVRIRQILVNLIGNALKFTSQGAIKIDGHYVVTPDDTIGVSLLVSDTGVGMSDEVAASLFKPFTQGDNTSTRRFGGTGLGLALSKKLGEALGGDVSLIRCEENKGCTFQFDFISTRAEQSEIAVVDLKSKNKKDAKVLEGYKILVADDSPDNRLLIELILTRHGAQFEFAEDGEEAVRKSLSQDFDIVLMDIQMPRLDGYGALINLRKANFKKPVLALTAHAMKEEKNRAMAAGFVDHIPKPINAIDLVDSILTHVNRD